MKKIYIYITVIMISMFFTGCNGTKVLNVTNAKNSISSGVSYFTDSSDDIAIIFPSHIVGKYAIESTNSVMSYLIYKNSDFNIEVFDTNDESLNSIKNVFNDISNKGITKVLVLLTYDGAKKLNDIDNISSFDIYLPLIHKDYLDLKLENVVYGSIDYSEQINRLLVHSNKKVIEFHDNSNLGNRLSKSIDNKNIKYLSKKEIKNENNEYKKFINSRNKRLQNSSLVINMPIVKSSIILSQINANSVDISNILSTQLNYTPLLLSLTQVADRKNMIIANSISRQNSIIEEYNALLDNDIVYNWVNFSSTIGIEYLTNGDVSNLNSVSIESNQVKYSISLYKTNKYSFIPLN